MRRAVAPLSTVALVGVALLGARAARGWALPMGPDPALWGLAGEELARGHAPAVAPGFPALLAAARLVGWPAWSSGGAISALATAVACGGVVALARAARASWVGVGVALAVVAAAPDTLGFATWLQPDATLAALLVAHAAIGLTAPRDARGDAAWLGAALLAASVREHGVVVLGATSLALAWRRDPRLAAALVAAGVLAVAAWIAWSPSGRLAGPLVESPLGAGRVPVPDYAKELTGPVGARFAAAWARGDRAAVWWITVERTLERAAIPLALVVIGAIGWGRRAPWATLAPVALSLGLWTHRRHVSVLVPVAAVGIGLLADRLGRARAAALVAGIVAAVGSLAVAARDVDRAAAGAGDARDVAAWMAAQPGAWMLGGRHNEVNLFLRWPRHDPGLPPPGAPLPTTWPGPDWRAMWVAPRGAMPPPFVLVHTAGGLGVFRLEAPAGQPRPCEGVGVVDGPWFTLTEVTGAVSTPCGGEARFDARPGAEGAWTAHPWVPAE